MQTVLRVTDRVITFERAVTTENKGCQLRAQEYCTNLHHYKMETLSLLRFQFKLIQKSIIKIKIGSSMNNSFDLSCSHDLSSN